MDEPTADVGVFVQDVTGLTTLLAEQTEMRDVGEFGERMFVRRSAAGQPVDLGPLPHALDAVTLRARPWAGGVRKGGEDRARGAAPGEPGASVPKPIGPTRAQESPHDLWGDSGSKNPRR